MQAMETMWTPNQQAAREKIIAAAADLIAEHDLSACTIRAVAEWSGLTKSTVHYYFDDANELIDLSVSEIFQRMARHAGESVIAAGDGVAGLEFLVRLFLGRAKTPRDVTFRQSMLWPAYTAHAWKRGATAAILHNLEALRRVFELALECAGTEADEAGERANSIHNYLLGAMVRNMIEPLDRDEVARAVTALTGVRVLSHPLLTSCATTDECPCSSGMIEHVVEDGVVAPGREARVRSGRAGDRLPWCSMGCFEKG